MIIADSETVLQSIYAAYAPVYDAQWARYSEATLSVAVEALMRVIRPGDERMLDVACGTGLLAGMAAFRFPTLRISGIDLSEPMLDRARAWLGDARRFDWRVARAESIPYPDATFDIVTCTNAFHLVRDAKLAIAEIKRVLKPAGRIVLVDWSRDSLRMRLLLKVLRFFRGPDRHVMSLAECVALFESSGFFVEEAQRFQATPVWGMMVVTAKVPRAAAVPRPISHPRRESSAKWVPAAVH
jgi:ubiquinone/menaquinone biosynthesis C-methylase UbiE